MRKFPAIAILVVLLVAIIGDSCKKDDCDEVIIPEKSLEELYGCADTRNDLIIDLTNEAIIITNQVDFEDKVDGTCSPIIDFATYDLIVGKATTTQSVDTIYYDYRIACPGGNKTLTVEIIQTATIAAETPVFHALVPKLGNGENVTLNVHVKNQ